MNNNNLTLSKVIDVNIYTSFRNILFDFFLNGIDIEKSIQKKHEYYCNSVTGIDRDITKEQIKERINKYIRKVKRDCKPIYLKDKERSDNIKSFKDFCEENNLPFKRMHEMQRFIFHTFQEL